MSLKCTFRRPAVGIGLIGGIVGTLLGSNWVLATRSESRIKPGFRLLPAQSQSASSRLFILFHGIWDGPDRFEWLPDFLSQYGQVLLVMTGGNDKHTPSETLAYLRRNRLIDRSLFVVGFSKGSLNACLVARQLIAEGHTPIGLAVKCGPPSPSAVLWPKRYLPIVVSLLPAGPITNFVWKTYWRRKQIHAQAAGRASEAAGAAWTRTMHVGAIISGARLLKRGINLAAGEFATIPTRIVFEQRRDPLIAPSAHLWRVPMGNSAVVVVIPTNIHGDFTGAKSAYRAGWLRVLEA